MHAIFCNLKALPFSGLTIKQEHSLIMCWFLQFIPAKFIFRFLLGIFVIALIPSSRMLIPDPVSNNKIVRISKLRFKSLRITLQKVRKVETKYGTGTIGIWSSVKIVVVLPEGCKISLGFWNLAFSFLKRSISLLKFVCCTFRFDDLPEPRKSLFFDKFSSENCLSFS